MSLAKLGAGDGYAYYTRSIATNDTNRDTDQKLAEYYSERGESPGIWLGSGLGSLGLAAGQRVTEPQMRALFGRGMHPNAEAIIAAHTTDGLAQGWSRRVARDYGVRMAKLGTAFGKYTTDEYGYRYEVARAFAAWNRDHDHLEAAPIPDADRERIRTEVAVRMFTEQYDRAPLDDRELSGWVARASRPATNAVAGYDLTFSPPKSVSVLWGLAPRELADRIEAAHHAAAADALAYLEAHAVYTRVGRGSVRQVDVEGLIATAYDHRDSRAGDPDLHTHLVISNKVRRVHDGKWGALDGRMIYRYNVPASELYNTRLEHHLEAALDGRIAFVERAGRDLQKRPIREITGVPDELMTAWSTRAEAITVKLGELSAQFQARHGREPTPKELLRLGEEATLSTRGGKHAARSRAEQRADWRHEAEQLLGGPAAVDDMVNTVLRHRVPDREPVTDAWIAATAAGVIEVVSASRATWKEHHVHAEAARQLRGRVHGHDWDTVMAAVTGTALAAPLSIPRGDHDVTAPVAALARADGTSVYTTAGSTLYTSPEIVAAERRLLTAATATGGRTLSRPQIATATWEYAATHIGRGLNEGQAALVESFATSGRRLQVAIAPAGTGKTTAMRVLTDAWTASGGTVLGLAPTAAAAATLATDTGVGAYTVDMLTTLADRLDTGHLDPADAPAWITSVGPATLVILDEAAKTPTLRLDSAVTWLLARGAGIRAVGDDRQLSAVAAGGVIRDIVHATGADTLTRVMRFADPAESAASLALRDGDPAAIAHYIDHGRVQVGTLGAVTEQAFRAWQADTDAGLDTLLLAPTRDLVTDLNQRARTARLTRGETTAGPGVRLADGLTASTGDVITTRRNHYRLWISATDHVRNGYRWRVTDVHDDGRVTAAHLGTGRTVTLPADYVTTDTTLGYAATIDSSQGMTVDTVHGVLTGREHRAQLYVMLTRGRTGNYAYLATAGPGDEADAYTYTALHPPTAVDILTTVIARDGTQTSATTAARDATDPALILAGEVDAYLDALGVIAEHQLGPDRTATIEAAAEQLVPGLTDAAAWPVLRQHLVLHALAGGDPAATLAHAVAGRELGTAADPAAVLDWRIAWRHEHDDPYTAAHNGTLGPLTWLPEIPRVLHGTDEYEAMLRPAREHIRDLHRQLTAAALTWTPATAPRWAQPFTDTPDLVADLAVWRAAHRVDDDDRRATGPVQYPRAEHTVQTDLDHRVRHALDDHATVARWAPLAADLDPRLTTDPYWPVLTALLDTAAQRGIDVTTAARTAAAARPLPDQQPAAALRWRLTTTLDAPGTSSDPGPDHHGGGTDPWRPLPGPVLQQRIQELRTLTHTARNDATTLAIPWRLRSRVDEVRERHARLDEQAPAIRTALHAAHAADTLAADLDAARQRYTDLSTQTPRRRRDRETRDAALTQVSGEILALMRRQEKVAGHAARTAVATGAPTDQWQAILDQAADTGTRATELDTARELDQNDAQRRAARAARVRELNETLAAALAEQERRGGPAEQPPPAATPTAQPRDWSQHHQPWLHHEPSRDHGIGL
ncbi:MobF family relaxase [Nocardia sp. alder85J]|uniref:MobF family relaxase n=1 Tax=Nocardia sp. alder85J TaxID=2862949 RepID=UPI0022568B71|nr:MobF family relaxase [Nocardia sp. alder85J]MCX4099261.1 relaxase domain-containing protein [Nocardia sp. alder85J]